MTLLMRDQENIQNAAVDAKRAYMYYRDLIAKETNNCSDKSTFSLKII